MGSVRYSRSEAVKKAQEFAAERKRKSEERQNRDLENRLERLKRAQANLQELAKPKASLISKF